MTLALAATLLVGLLFLGAMTHKVELLAAFIPAGLIPPPTPVAIQALPLKDPFHLPVRAMR